MALQTGTDQPTTRRLTRTTEVTPMQLATLDREPTTGAAVADAFASLTALTGLSALAERVADEQLPCRVNDPELFFATSRCGSGAGPHRAHIRPASIRGGERTTAQPATSARPAQAAERT